MSIWFRLLYSILLLTTQCAAMHTDSQCAAADPRHRYVNLDRIEFRRAVMDDLDAIRKLYTRAYKDCEPGLILLPEPFRTRAIKRSLRLGRLFIAINFDDDNKPEVVSVVKIFVMGASQEGLTEEEAVNEESAILTEELRCRARNRQDQVHCCIKGSCTCPPFTFTYRPPSWDPQLQPNAQLKYASSPQQTYIYFGGAYTYPWLRKNGINSELERRALEAQVDDVMADVLLRRSKKLIYAYGVTEDNSATNTHIQAFCCFVQAVKAELDLPLNTKRNPLELGCFKFATFKPEYIMKQSHKGRPLLNRLPDKQENAGYGCLIVCPLEANYSSRSDSPPPEQKEPHIVPTSRTSKIAPTTLHSSCQERALCR